ncbi:hypothetical protein KAI04_04040 [Candidatus Pacearchaeota archaeon]|nr:hypothetical protein [Candidatus Pacearchaeota archaeon]
MTKKYMQTLDSCPICGNKKLKTYRNANKIIINFCDKCDTEIVNRGYDK